MVHAAAQLTFHFPVAERAVHPFFTANVVPAGSAWGMPKASSGSTLRRSVDNLVTAGVARRLVEDAVEDRGGVRRGDLAYDQ